MMTEKRSAEKAVLSRQITDSGASFMRLEKPNDLLFCIPFALHNETSHRSI